MTRAYKLVPILAVCAAAFVLNGCGGSTPYSPIITQTGGPDFTVTPASQSGNFQEFGEDISIKRPGGFVRPGGFFVVRTTFNLTLTSVNGFAGTVNLKVTNPDAEFLQTNIPSSATLSAGGTTPVKIQIASDTDFDPQDFNFTVTATSGSLSHTASLVMHVVNADFGLAPDSQTQTYQDDAEGAPTFTYNLSASSIGDFTGDVSLSVISPNLSGTGDFTLLLPTKVTISKAGGSTPFTFSIVADDPALEVGTYQYTIVGEADNIQKQAYCTVIVSNDGGKKKVSVFFKR